MKVRKISRLLKVKNDQEKMKRKRLLERSLKKKMTPLARERPSIPKRKN
jgi:hypothetical protein